MGFLMVLCVPAGLVIEDPSNSLRVMEQGLNGTEFSRLRQFENQMQVLNFSLRCLNGNEHCLTNANKAIKEQESKQ